MHERRRRADRRISVLHPLAGDLSRALAGDALDMLFQPQISAADGSVAGAEALARWRHPKRGEFGGEELFAIARRSKLSQAVSRYVLAASMREAAAWPDGLKLSLNIAASDLAARDFVEMVEAALDRAEFPAARLTLEITEQALVENLETSAERLRQLAELGVSIALDDFGAGFCNFRYLKALPLHALKLDRSMIEGISADERDLAILRGIVTMARALDLEVIAEGVETEAQREVVEQEGCACWQGFLRARPMEAADFRRLVQG